MIKAFKSYFKKEDGLGTVEIVLLIAILVGLALIFKNIIVGFVKNVLANIQGNEIDPTNLQ